MKNRCILALFLFSSQLSAQENSLKTEVAYIVQREDKLILNFTSDNWGNLASDITSKPFRSRGLSFLLMNEKMNMKGNIGIGTGLGFMYQNVHTDGKITDTTSDESVSILEKIPDSLSYEQNKLSLNFITLALEIRFRSNVNKKGDVFKFSLGMLAGILVQSHTKYEDKNGKVKTYNVNHLNNFQYGVSGRLGYDNYGISGYYSLADVFEESKGPELLPYSLGITFTF